MKPWLAAVLAVALSACGSGSTDDAMADDAPAPPATPLDAVAQEARFKGCSARHDALTQLGVIKHGSARPGVDPRAWELLTKAEQREVYDVAACLASGGQNSERIVTIVEAGTDREIGTVRVNNTRQF